MFDSIPFLPAREVCIVGDSNCFPFGSHVIGLPEIFARPIVLRTHGISGLTAAATFSEEQLHPDIAAFLRGCNIPNFFAEDRIELLNRRRGFPRVKTRADQWPGEDEPVVFVIVGMVDFFHVVAQIGPLSDFHLDDPRYHADRFPLFPKLPLTPRSVVDELIARRFEPLAAFLSELRKLGLRNVYFHSIHPPTTNDDIYWQNVAVNSIARVRYKVAILMNRELERIGQTEGFVLIDPWDDFTEGGVVSDRFYFDGMHLNVDAARTSILRLLQEVVRRRVY